MKKLTAKLLDFDKLEEFFIARIPRIVDKVYGNGKFNEDELQQIMQSVYDQFPVIRDILENAVEESLRSDEFKQTIREAIKEFTQFKIQYPDETARYYAEVREKYDILLEKYFNNHKKVREKLAEEYSTTPGNIKTIYYSQKYS